MSLKQGSRIVTDAICTPSYYKMMRPKKVKVMVPSETSITSSQCQDCGRFLSRKRLVVQKIYPVEKMNLKIRSVEEKINGVFEAV